MIITGRRIHEPGVCLDISLSMALNTWRKSAPVGRSVFRIVKENIIQDYRKTAGGVPSPAVFIDRCEFISRKNIIRDRRRYTTQKIDTDIVSHKSVVTDGGTRRHRQRMLDRQFIIKKKILLDNRILTGPEVDRVIQIIFNDIVGNGHVITLNPDRAIGVSAIDRAAGNRESLNAVIPHSSDEVFVSASSVQDGRFRIFALKINPLL